MAQPQFSVYASLVVVFVCSSSTVSGQPDLDIPTPTTPPRNNSTVIKCSTPPGSKFIVTSAQFSQASKLFCRLDVCLPVTNTSTETYECRPGPSQTCSRVFSGKDMWQLYTGCGAQLRQPVPCIHEETFAGHLSQEGRYEVDYECLDGTIEPCGAEVSGETKDVYQDFSSMKHHRQCSCVGKVLGLEEHRDEYVAVLVQYLLLLEPSLLSSSDHDIVEVTVSSENGRHRVQAGWFPAADMFVNVTRDSPSIDVTLRVRHNDGILSGFLWLRFQDFAASLTCTSSKDFTDTPEAGEATTTFDRVVSNPPSKESPGSDWLTISAVAAAAGAVAVIVSLLLLCAVFRRRRRHQRAPNADNPRPSTDAYNTYAEVIPQNPQNPPPNHHHPHNPPPDYSEPSHAQARLPGNDVSDYANLHHHAGQRAPPGGGSDDTYDHTLRSREEYQALDRGAGHQQVIDHDYDSTEGCAGGQASA
ncbi:hypothetical protein ACOMHN_006867 [Nucella lapillus]